MCFSGSQSFSTIRITIDTVLNGAISQRSDQTCCATKRKSVDERCRPYAPTTMKSTKVLLVIFLAQVYKTKFEHFDTSHPHIMRYAGHIGSTLHGYKLFCRTHKTSVLLSTFIRHSIGTD